MSVRDQENAENAEIVLRLASEKPPGLLRSVLGFLQTTRKWWLGPVLVFALLFGLLVALGGSGAGPFLYTVF